MSALLTLRTAAEALAWLRQHAAASADLHNDSRQLRAGDVFLAWPGHAQDGRAHVAAALRSGAAAVLAEARGANVAALQEAAQTCGGAVALYEGLAQAAGALAHDWYGQPSAHMEVLAITGTNGKTTLAWWLAHVLGEQGLSCGYVGTLGVGLPPQVQELGLTLPDALRLQRTLQQLRAAGAQACAIEASSIGLEQGRLGGTQIRVAVFTNLTQDHLDYHGSMQAYGQAKQLLFTWPGLQAAVLNAQDAHGLHLRGVAAAHGVAVWDYAVAAEGLPPAHARLTATDVHFAAGAATFVLREYAASAPDAQTRPVQSLPVQANVTGLYNVQNLLALIGALRARGVSLEQAAVLCRALPAVPGRMQLAQLGKEEQGVQGQPQVVVDYAHTPDALRAALQALRPVAQQRGGQLVAVFGCGGDRDPGKRPLMAQAAAQGADAIWLTSDNPRTEDAATIIEHMAAGLAPAQRQAAHICADRRAAIARAIAGASAADVVLIAGKGHEDYQDIKGVKHPFSDMEEAHKALRARSVAVQEEGAP